MVTPDRGGWAGASTFERPRPHVDRSAFVGFRFPPEVVATTLLAASAFTALAQAM
jgi:hypothetical protein